MGKVTRSIKANFSILYNLLRSRVQRTYCPPFYQTSDNRFKAMTISFDVLACSITRSIFCKCVDVYDTFCISTFLFVLVNLKIKPCRSIKPISII